jgi:DNA-binding NarL/FixJ family response regulator
MKRILIAEDDACLSTAYRALLARNAELKVDFAAEPGAAHRLMREHDYDAALFDIELASDETGLDLLRAMRHDHPQTPVLMMSSLDDSRTVERCMALGASGFASKNRDFLQSLPARVRVLLEQRTAQVALWRKVHNCNQPFGLERGKNSTITRQQSDESRVG